MNRSARAYARIVLFACAGDFLVGLAAMKAGLPGLPACLLGGLLGLVASCVPWRQVLWLRLQVAMLRSRPGLVYLRADYGGREPVPEVPAPKRLARAEASCDCRNCRDLENWADGVPWRAGCRDHARFGPWPSAIVIGGNAYRTLEDLRNLPNPPLDPPSGRITP